MNLTKKQVKEETLLVWRYLRDHPEIDDKANLPSEIFCKVMSYDHFCPLCEKYRTPYIFGESQVCSAECPLNPYNFTCGCSTGSPYVRWCGHLSLYCGNKELSAIELNKQKREMRAQAAGEIVQMVEAWDISELHNEEHI